MPRTKRIELIKKIEEIRQSKVICYLTSLRPNVGAQMAEDAVRIFFDFMLDLPARPVEKVDIFLCSNGGNGIVPWRLIPLFREFASKIGVLIPYRAYSAATLLALGADEIVMHPFGELGPIDPKVANEFNPQDQAGKKVGINVEDVNAYISFIKDTVGITHEDELVKTVEILAQQVHPLALGNVERFYSQTRVVAKKILRTHMKDIDEHVIDEIIETMASRLYFHGHPINRREAKEDLRLKSITVDLPPALETHIWDLYRDFEIDFENLTPFLPHADLAMAPPPDANGPQEIIKEYSLLNAVIESNNRAMRHMSRRRFTRLTIPTAQGPMPVVREEPLALTWESNPEDDPKSQGSGPSGNTPAETP